MTPSMTRGARDENRSRFGTELDSLVDAVSFGVARPSSVLAS